jgi:hypothetical protein
MRGGFRPGAGRPKGSLNKPKDSKESIGEIKERNERLPETIDGSSGKPDALPRNPRLSSLKDVRLEMAYVYKRMENRIIETADGSKLIFALSKIGDIITVAEFEERIEQLEQQRQELLAQRALPAVYAEG